MIQFNRLRASDWPPIHTYGPIPPPPPPELEKFFLFGDKTGGTSGWQVPTNSLEWIPRQQANIDVLSDGVSFSIVYLSSSFLSPFQINSSGYESYGKLTLEDIGLEVGNTYVLTVNVKSVYTSFQRRYGVTELEFACQLTQDSYTFYSIPYNKTISSIELTTEPFIYEPTTSFHSLKIGLYLRKGIWVEKDRGTFKFEQIYFTKID